MPLETFAFDAAEYITDPEDQADLVADALSTGNPAVIKHALEIVARARGMSQVARDAGVTQENLNQALGPHGDPSLSVLLDVLAALGLRLSAIAGAPVPSA